MFISFHFLALKTIIFVCTALALSRLGDQLLACKDALYTFTFTFSEIPRSNSRGTSVRENV